MKKLIEKFTQAGVVPVVKINRAKDALPLCRALIKGGINVVEITLRSDAALDAIKLIKSELPEMCIAAGTVTSPRLAKAAHSAGAELLVSPGLNEKTLSYCSENNIPIIPGVCTPSDIERGLAFGLEYFKFFPAEASGGVPMLKALSGPFGGIKFMPTGGINPDNLKSYLALSSVFCCGGSWMVPERLIDNGNFDEITRLCIEAKDLH